MMTEFNTSGFDVVDKFFGSTDDPKAVSAGAGADATVKHGGGNNRHRGGVGHSKTSDSTDKTNEALRSTLLKVGRTKRSSRGTIDDDDDGDHDGNNDDDHHHHQDDPDEDLGRTAIASDRPNTDSSNNSKKKLGKKERMKLKKLEKEVGKGTTEDTSQPETNQGERKEEGQDVTEQQEQKHNQPKKKRRKVRSRQKNIYKDKRSTEEKPSHLIPGSRDYAGRPMTHATRKRLNLPENPLPTTKRNKLGNHQHCTSPSNTGDDGDGDDDLYVIDREPSTAGVDDGMVGEKLAVDDFQSSDEEDDRDDDNDQGEVINVDGGSSPVQQNGDDDDDNNNNGLLKEKSDKTREMKKKKKKTKKRFKNLM